MMSKIIAPKLIAKIERQCKATIKCIGQLKSDPELGTQVKQDMMCLVSLLKQLLDDLTHLQQEKFYLLKSRGSNRGIEYLNWLTSTELNTPEWTKELENLKSGEYCTQYISLEEVSKSRYEKAMREIAAMKERWVKSQSDNA